MIFSAFWAIPSSVKILLPLQLPKNTLKIRALATSKKMRLIGGHNLPPPQAPGLNKVNISAKKMYRRVSSVPLYCYNPENTLCQSKAKKLFANPRVKNFLAQLGLHFSS